MKAEILCRWEEKSAEEISFCQSVQLRRHVDETTGVADNGWSQPKAHDPANVKWGYFRISTHVIREIKMIRKCFLFPWKP